MEGVLGQGAARGKETATGRWIVLVLGGAVR